LFRFGLAFVALFAIPRGTLHFASLAQGTTLVTQIDPPTLLVAKHPTIPSLGTGMKKAGQSVARTAWFACVVL
jgi:hypothetical protein